MKKLITGLLSCFAVVLLTIPVALAQTPDGITPPNEGICDDLQTDGITKGLFGLCVAFCEAQDWADVNDPITEEDLLALEASAPSGKILENYNKKKDKADNGLDPEMPCILVEEPCPCWSQAELDAFDGLDNNNNSQAHKTCTNVPNRTQTREFGGGYGNILNVRGIFNGNPRCLYSDDNAGIQRGPLALTDDQANACRTQIQDNCVLFPPSP